MRVALSKTFYDSVYRLSRTDQKKTGDLLDKLFDERATRVRRHPVMNGFVSLRPKEREGLIVIAAQIGDRLVLCYADQHDDAYRWAETRTPRAIADFGISWHSTVVLDIIPQFMQTSNVCLVRQFGESLILGRRCKRRPFFVFHDGFDVSLQ